MLLPTLCGLAHLGDVGLVSLRFFAWTKVHAYADGRRLGSGPSGIAPRFTGATPRRSAAQWKRPHARLMRTPYRYHSHGTFSHPLALLC